MTMLDLLEKIKKQDPGTEWQHKENNVQTILLKDFSAISFT